MTPPDLNSVPGTGFVPLREHKNATLAGIQHAVDYILRRPTAVPPPELRIKLDTYGADLAAAIEDTAPSAPALPRRAPRRPAD